jgi:lipopolysaccharide transport system permease protein
MSAESQSTVVIEPGSTWRLLALRDVWEYRYLLLMFGLRDVKLRYKQTFLGVLWVVMQPLLSAGLMTVVFGYIAGMPSAEGVPYFAFAYTGQLAWTLFSLAVARTAGSMVGNIAMVTKIYFPRPILPFASLLAALLDFAIASAIAIPIVVIYGQGWPNLPAVLGASVLLLLGATGIGLLLAAVSVSYRDALYVLPLLLQVGLYACPVAYGLQVVRESLSKFSPAYFEIYMLNPAASLVELFRWGLLGQGLITPRHVTYSAVACSLVFVVGLVVFRRSEGRFADVI